MAPPDYRLIERALKATAPSPSTGGYGAAPAPYIGPGPSPLVASYNDWGPYASGRSLGTNAALPREWMAFLSGMFGPLEPIRPVPIDVPAPGEQRPAPRTKQLNVGWNMPTPPGTEGVGKLADFQSLRSISDLYSVARRCIQLRKDEMRGIGWDVVPTRQAAKAMRGDHRYAAEFGERQAKVWRFFSRPDTNYADFGTWFNAMLEEFFVTDALSLYMWPARSRHGGVAGSWLAELNQVDGSTMRPLVDVRGGVPRPPNPSYQQYIFGVPRTDLMALRAGEDLEGVSEEELVAEYRSDQLMYLPYSPRVWSPYGQSFIETGLVPVLSGINKQTYQMNYFTEGTIPGLIISPGDPSLTATQLKVLQDSFNAIAGDQAWKHRIIVAPGGSRVDPLRPGPLADEFDTLVQIQTAMAFDVQPFELGILPQLSAAAASSGAARQMVGARVDIRQRKSTIPILLFLKTAVFDRVIQGICGYTDMEWSWQGLEEDQNIAELTEALVAQVGAGLLSIDEGRQMLGREPWGLPITSDPGWATSWGGLVPLTGVTEATAQPLGGSPGPGGPGRGTGARQTVVDLTGRRPVRPGSPSAPSVVPRNRMSPAQRRGQAAAVTTAQNSTGTRGTPAHAGARAAAPLGRPAATAKAIAAALSADTLGEFQAATGTPLWAQVIQGAVEPPDGGPHMGPGPGLGLGSPETGVTAEAARELGLLRSHLRRGEQVSSWEPRFIPPRVLSQVAEDMAKGMSAAEACDTARLWLAAQARKGTAGYSLNPRSGMVSLDVPQGLVEPLPGGVEDHHITVVYLGPDVDDVAFAAACERAREAAASVPGPLCGHVGGLGSFPPSVSSDGKVPVFAEVHLPGAQALRAALADLSASEHTDWHAHVTIAYLDGDDPLPEPLEPVPVTFTHLSVHRGTDVERFPLGGAHRKAKGKERYPVPVAGRKVPAAAVRRQLLGNFPPGAIDWVMDTGWVLADVPMDVVDFRARHTWAASHEKDRVRHFARLYRAGQPVDPPVMVWPRGHRHVRVVDGHHRTEGCRDAGRDSVRAYVGTVPAGDGPWFETHSHQEHQGDDPLNKSERTPYVSTVHHPVGHESLWHTPDRHVASMQQLPAYIQNTALALEREGHDEQSAIALAVAAVEAWAAGHAFGGKVRVTPQVRAAAQRALGEWERLKASHHGPAHAGSSRR